MSLIPGARLGHYEIVAPLGAGGMGEVYRARDTRLDRAVAIKVLPAGFAADADRLQRFEHEARAAGMLNHPNVLTIYDVGTADGKPFIVSELLEGTTLRSELNESAMAVRKAIDYGLQIARGLAAAHDKGIVHRDLKPENIFVTYDERVKILDFGLAKLRRPEDTLETLAASPPETQAGVVLGTVAYMSPEQVRGQQADHRSDIFSFGSVLYEMLSGRRPFRGESLADTMGAILKEDPPDPLSWGARIPPVLERIVRRCLEKKPGERFHSAHDLGLAIEAVSTGSSWGSDTGLPRPSTRKPRLPLRLVAGAIILSAAALAAGYTLAAWRAEPPASPAGAVPPSFQRLTFRRGLITAARFAPDSQTIVYSAGWEGGPQELYLTRPESPESRPLGLRNADLLSIAASGEMAVLLSPATPISVYDRRGTLARLPMAGGAPRELLENVRAADWTPDGQGLAVVRHAGGGPRLELPAGTVLVEGPAVLLSPRVSRDGRLVAFFERDESTERDFAVSVVDRSGQKRQLSPGWWEYWNLAWGPDGREIWFGATETGMSSALYAVDLSGRQRVLARIPGSLELHDVAADGRVLLTRVAARGIIVGVPPGESVERDVSSFDGSHLKQVSRDGRLLLFDEQFEASGRTGSVYLRKTDGSPAVRLGDGNGRAISPDGRWVLTTPASGRPALHLVPVGAGETRTLAAGLFARIGAAQWFPDGARVLVSAAEEGKPTRLYTLALADGEPRPLGPEGIRLNYFGTAISPDGRLAAGLATDGRVKLIPTDGGDVRAAPGVAPGEAPVQWSADGRSLYVLARGTLPGRVYRVDMTSGRRELWKELAPHDPAGVGLIAAVVMTPDARSYFYSFNQFLSELYLVKGLK